MNRVVLDTNVVRGLFKGQRKIVSTLDNFDEIILPFAVVAELYSGYKVGDRYEKNKKIIDKFVNDNSVLVVFPDSKTLEIYSDFYLYLRKQGTPIPINDIWIAAITYQMSEKLYTLDKDFDNLPQIMKLI
jgi:predicted nucleic acid-binding protein